MLINRSTRFHGIVDRESVYEIEDGLYDTLKSQGMTDEEIFKQEFSSYNNDSRIKLVMSVDEVDEITQDHVDDIEFADRGSASVNGYVDVAGLADMLEMAASADVYYNRNEADTAEDGSNPADDIGAYQNAMVIAAAILRSQADKINNLIPEALKGLYIDPTLARVDVDVTTDKTIGVEAAIDAVRDDDELSLYKCEVFMFDSEDPGTSFDSRMVVVAAGNEHSAREAAKRLAEDSVITIGSVSFESDHPELVDEDELSNSKTTSRRPKL